MGLTRPHSSRSADHACVVDDAPESPRGLESCCCWAGVSKENGRELFPPSHPLHAVVPTGQAALRRARTAYIVAPIAEGFGATVMPAALRISTFSCALSPKAETIAPACPILRPFGADRPSI